MITVKRALTVPSLLIAVVLASCSSNQDQAQEPWNPEDDRSDIQATLEETAVRWHYGDKAVLYEQEFECVQVEYTYDQYLEIDKVKRLESDTVRNFLVRDVQFFDRDSAYVKVDVVFMGPAGIETYFPQDWTMYYHRGRWIRPTISDPVSQQRFEERRRKADSAARAEENEVW